MAIVAPPGRKHLSGDALFRLVRPGFANLPDQRGGEAELSFPEVLMSAFAMFPSNRLRCSPLTSNGQRAM